MKFMKYPFCFAILLSACTSFAQMYTITDLQIGNQFGDSFPRWGYGDKMNNLGQVVGEAGGQPNCFDGAFRTAPNSPVNPATDFLDCNNSARSRAHDINDSGQVTGDFTISGSGFMHAFRTAPNSPINPATDDLGTLGGRVSYGYAMNASGQVAGMSEIANNATMHAFRTAPNSAIHSETDDLGPLGAWGTVSAINDSGQVAGHSAISGSGFLHAFRTAPNSPINPATDDLGTLGGRVSYGYAMNASGQVAGASMTANNAAMHAFRTAPNSAIHPETDDLGTLGGNSSFAYAIDAYGQVLGTSETLRSWTRAFLYSNGVMRDLTNLVEVAGYDPCKTLGNGVDINAAGQILVQDICGYYLLLNPIYKASVQPPIDSDGSSIFSTRRRVIPVKFALTQYGAPTCTLLPATIAVVRTSGDPRGSIAESNYSGNANDGSNFRIDAAACQYIYNLPTAELGVGSYRLDISINGIMVGHGGFALR